MGKWTVWVCCVTWALAGAGCAVDTADEDETLSGAADEDQEEETSREGDEQITEDELRIGSNNTKGFEEPTYDAAEKAEVLAQYTHVDPDHKVPTVLLENALQYYHFNKSRLQNDGWMTIIDMGQHSGKQRFYKIGMDSGNVTTTVVAHGSGSDPENDGTPSRFSNTQDSHMTSIGYYLTAETYSGSWGYSLKLDGLSKTNSNARARAVVMHGASYVARGKSKQGRSWGCPALPLNEKDAMINDLRGGSLLYIDTVAAAESR